MSTPIPDGQRADVADIADRFMAQLTAWAANYRADLSTDIRGPLADVVTALHEVVLPDVVSRFEQECLAVIGEHERWLAVPGTNNMLSMPATALAAAWAALDEALTPFDAQQTVAAYDELTAARAALDHLRAQQQQALDRGEVEAVRGLREAIELTAPTRVAEARARLRDLEVQRMRVALERPTRRWEQARALVDQLTVAQADAEAAWLAATEALKAAAQQRTAPAQVRTRAEQRLQEAENLRAAEAVAAAADRAARLRTLTGLPA